MARPGKTPKMQLLEAQDGAQRPIEDILVAAYTESGSQAAAAENLGISRALFNQWVYRLGIGKLLSEVDEIRAAS